MNNYLSLTKVFLKALSMSKVTGKKKIIFYFFLASVLFLIFIPFILFCGVFVYGMTNSLKEVGYGMIGFELMGFLISIFTFVFSFNVILNQLYFSDDIECLLPLPIRPVMIVASKFTSCFVAENIMQFLLVLVSVFGYSLAMQLPLANLLFSLIGIITLPIIPMIYCSIISLLLMSFTKFIRNKETIRKIGVFFVLLILILFGVGMSYLQQFNFETYVESFALGNHKFLEAMRVVFPHISLFVKSFTNMDIIAFLEYVLINIVFIFGFLGLAHFLYLDSVIELSSKDTKPSGDSLKLLENTHSRSVFVSYFSKELKVLFRSPAFFINCILINFIWPVFAYVIYKVTLSDYSLSKIRILISDGNVKVSLFIFLVVAGVSILLPALNSIAASSFSREGKHFSFLKYIPVRYRIQWRVKVLVSFIISFIGVNVFTTIFYLFMNIPILFGIELYFISFFCILLVSILGVYVDSIQPKLIWDDEANSLRENYNTFMLMGFALLFFGLICGGGYYLYTRGIMLPNIIILSMIILVCLTLFIWNISVLSIPNNIIEQEEA